MNEFDRSIAESAVKAVRYERERHVQWTDNVARVYEVIARHPEVSVEWPRWSGKREFVASWPADPKDPESKIDAMQTLELGELATALEEKFPVDGSDD